MTKVKSPPPDVSESKEAPQTRLIDRPWLVTAAWYVAGGLTAWSFGYATVAAGDLWWHVATGRLMVEQRAIPLVDSFSYTREGQPWLQHEWLSDLIFAVWERAFGLQALVYWKWAVLVVAFVLLLAVLRRTTREPAAAYLGTLAAAAVSANFLDIRPHLYSLTGFTLLLLLTYDRKRLPIALPVLFLVWVNLHGGFFFGLMALAVIVSARFIHGDRDDLRRSLLVVTGCCLAALVNPNGIGAFAYPIRYAFDSTSPFREVIAEWKPPFEPSGIHSPLYPWAIGLFIVAVAFTFASRAYRQERGVPVAGLALGFLTLAMSLTSRRFIPLFAIAQSLAVVPALGYLIAPFTQRVPKLVPAAAAAVIGLVLLLQHPLSLRAFGEMTAEAQFPKRAVDFAEANGVSGHVFAYYNWGGYLHLRTAGRLKVFIDGRADTVYDDETLQRYRLVNAKKPGWLEVIESSGARYILWPIAEVKPMLGPLQSSGRWRILFHDDQALLVERIDPAS